MPTLKQSLMLVLTLLGFTCNAKADEAIECKYVNEKIEQQIGFCSSVRVGDLLYVSGKVGGGDMRAAVEQVYTQLGEVLASHGLSFKQVFKENLYTTDMEATKQHLSLRKSFYLGRAPAATWVQVDRLYDSGILLEVEIIATFNKE